MKAREPDILQKSRMGVPHDKEKEGVLRSGFAIDLAERWNTGYIDVGILRPLGEISGRGEAHVVATLHSPH